MWCSEQQNRVEHNVQSPTDPEETTEQETPMVFIDVTKAWCPEDSTNPQKVWIYLIKALHERIHTK